MQDTPPVGPLALSSATEAVHGLYARIGSPGLSADGFLPLALADLERRVPFDVALVTTVDTAGAAGGGLRTSAAAAPGNEALAARARRPDAVQRALHATPHLSVRWTDAGPGPSAHALALVTRDTPDGLRRHLGLWREGFRRPFTELDAQWVEFVAPHLLLASRMHLSAVGRRLTPAIPATAGGAVALCDAQGALVEAEEGFLAELRAEHSRWPGAWLPSPYRPLLDAATEIAGRQVAIRRIGAGPPYVLQLRRLGAADRLSATQRLVAEQLAAGSSHVEVAARLGISTTTVRNHTAAIYRRLGIRNRAQLASAVRASGRPAGGHAAAAAVTRPPLPQGAVAAAPGADGSPAL
jgi:DNA-binding CsgD family transcriptional regulator